MLQNSPCDLRPPYISNLNIPTFEKQLQAMATFFFLLFPFFMNTTRSKVPHIGVTSIPESQISVSFALRPDVLKVHAILRKVHQMTKKWPWTLQGQRYPIYVLLEYCPWVPNFSRFPSTTSCFRVLGQFETSALNDPKMTLDTTRSNTPHIYVTGTPPPPNSKFNSPHFALSPFCLWDTTCQKL